jgi:hypothetical protein
MAKLALVAPCLGVEPQFQEQNPLDFKRVVLR